MKNLLVMPTICAWDECANLLDQRRVRGRPRKFCTQSHQKKMERFLRDQRPPVRVCDVEGCERRHRAKGLCAVHWIAADRATNGRKKEPWNDRARHAYHARRAQKRGTAVAGPVLLAAIGDRDEWRCGICEEPVSPALSYSDPCSPSLDHIVPLSRGGGHTPENCQIAHLRCNLIKHNKI